jgi:hypothetical protein
METLELHHMPQDWLMQNKWGIVHAAGGTIAMDRLDHYRTRTRGHASIATRQQDFNLSFSAVLALDVADILSINSARYVASVGGLYAWYAFRHPNWLSLP